MKKLSLFIIIGILVMPIFYLNIENVLADSTTYYVANTGFDTNNGLSPSSPWKTIGKVNTAITAGTIKVGDDIYFKRGDTFTDASLTVKVGGTSSDWLVIGAYGTGVNPIIDSTVKGVTITTKDVNYVRVENFTLSNQAGYGVECAVANHTNIYLFNLVVSDNGDCGIYFDRTYYPTVENCTVHDVHTGGIVFYGSSSHRISYGKILNCTVYNCGLVTPSDGIIIHEGDSLEPYGKNFLIKGCESYGNSEQGYDFYGGHGGGNIACIDCISHNNDGFVDFGADGNNVTFINCLSYDENLFSDSAAITVGNNVNQVIMRNTIVYRSQWYTFVTYDDIGTTSCQNITVYNSDFITDEPAGNYPLFYENTGKDKNLIFKNNIFMNLNSATTGLLVRYATPDTPASTNSNWSHNIWWNNGGAVSNQWYYGGTLHNWASWITLAQTVGDIRDDPELADIANHDFTLDTTSPCIDTGDWLTYTNGGGTGTVVTLDNAHYFYDGYGLTDGDFVTIGTDENLKIIEVNYLTNQITVDRSFTWADNDLVGFAYNDAAPDIGAYEFLSSTPNPLPKITQIIFTTSDPLDTDPLYGWVNISCTVTDDAGVNTVQLRIKNPNNTWNNITMNKRNTNNYYYQSSNAFSQQGNYSYIIRAIDIDNNINLSDNQKFSMSPNWDINSDGECSILDITLVSNHYDDVGASGWIRQDVNNDGKIDLIDLVSISNHYGDSWYT
jgi:hypothetical protein